MNAKARTITHRSRRFLHSTTDFEHAEFKQDWRCQACRKLLGKTNGIQMQIRRTPLDYVVGFPVFATCPGCGSLNVMNKP